MLVKLEQVYYTLSVAAPSNPTDFFRDGINAGELGGVSPAYVSSVSYGRIAIMTISSESDSTSIAAAIQASISTPADIGVDVEIGGSHRSLLQTCEMNVVIIGGRTDTAGKSIQGLDGFLEFVNSGHDAEAKKYAVPIGYELRYLSDNSLVPGGRVANKREVPSNPSNMTVTVTLDSVTATKNSDEATIEIDATKTDAYRKSNIFTYKFKNNSLEKGASKIDLTFIGAGDDAAIDLRPTIKRNDIINTLTFWNSSNTDYNDGQILLLECLEGAKTKYSFDYDGWTFNYIIEKKALEKTNTDIKKGSVNMMIKVKFDPFITELKDVILTVDVRNMAAYSKQEKFTYSKVKGVLNENDFKKPIELVYIGADDNGVLDLSGIEVKFDDGILGIGATVLKDLESKVIRFADFDLGESRHSIEYVSSKSNEEAVVKLNVTIKKEIIY